MDIASPDVMARFADDVRQQQEPFVREATALFERLIREEYTRLRSHALEAGSQSAVLHVNVEFCFDPETRSVKLTSAPAAMQPKPRIKAARVGSQT